MASLKYYCIDYVRIPHNTLCLLPNFLKIIAFKHSWEYEVLGAAFVHVQEIVDATLRGRVAGANREYYGGFEIGSAGKISI